MLSRSESRRHCWTAHPTLALAWGGKGYTRKAIRSLPPCPNTMWMQNRGWASLTPKWVHGRVCISLYHTTSGYRQPWACFQGHALGGCGHVCPRAEGAGRLRLWVQ
jgi:hypothetical protein